MKRLLLILAGIALYVVSPAQCSMIEVPLQQRAAASDLIVEGKVTAKSSFWNRNNTMIYTSNTIEVYKIFKGDVSSSTIVLLTEGGVVGDRMIKANPSLELTVGEVGVFTCETVKRFHDVPMSRTTIPVFEAYASAQGFVKYNLNDQTASDVFKTYSDIENEVYNVVLSPTMHGYREVQSFNLHSNQHIGPQFSVQSISSFAPSSITAGTGSVLTINGSGFGATQGSGTVGFKNADDGGSSYITPLASQYIAWSNTLIKVVVPANAGTGTIQVTQGVTTTSSSTLTITYANLNVDFDPGSGTEAYQTDHVDDNGSGGYTWQMNPGFASNSAAVAAFQRAFDNWRCNTGINWTIGSNTAINDAVSDGTNVICFDNTAPLSAGILGVCYSYWSGCASGPNIVWYVNELDIIFDEGSNISPLTWNYGPGLPTGSQYDFESVAVHELGHGHQLGHVISPGAIMHYALSNGASNRTPGTDDLAGANNVQANSEAGNICGPGAMVRYSCASPPVASFSGTPTSICAGASVSFTDLSTNTPTSWAWTFPGGTPGTSTSQNPSVTYSTPGTYNVSLSAANAAGTGTVTMTGYITVNPAPSGSGSVTNVTCNGGNDGSINFSPTGGTSPYTFFWNPSGQTTEDRTSLSAGSYSVTVTDNNGCTFQTSFSVTEPNALTLNMGSTNATCSSSNGTATATPSGGTAPYFYSWAPGGQTTQTATALAGGTYTCTVTDNAGCTTMNTVTVNVTPCGGPTQLVAGNCGMTATSLNQQIYCVPVSGATNYRYRFTNSAQGYNQVFTRGNNLTNFYLTWATGIQYGRTYNVEVAAFVSGVWSAYGSICTVTTPATIPTTQLTGTYCGATLTSMSQLFYANVVPGADYYEFRFTQSSPSFSASYVHNTLNADCRAQWISGLQYGQTYNVDVRAKVGGVWGSFGGVCTLTLPSLNTTQLTAAWCGATLTSLSQQFYATTVTNATKYEFRFQQAATSFSSSFVHNATTSDCRAQWIPNIQYGQTYDVDVRAYVNGAWSSFGSVCQLTTPAFPTTQVTATYCGATLAAVSSQILCTSVLGATNYEWKVENAALGYSNTAQRNNSQTNWYLSWNAGTQINTTYTVTVRAYVGGVWGSFGPACTVTTGPTAMVPDSRDDASVNPARMDNSLVNPAMDVYPNPVSNNVTIETDIPVQTLVIYNAFGEVVRTEEINAMKAELDLSELTPGIYMIQARTENGMVTKRIIKQ